MKRAFEMHYEITVEYDSGRLLALEAFSRSEYLSRTAPLLKDSKVKAIWVKRVEKFLTERLMPVGR